MLRILICDDDIAIISKIHSIVESVLRESGERTKFYMYSDASSISGSVLSGCDIAILDVDFPDCKDNGMDIARKIRSARRDTVILFVTNFIEYAPAGYEVQAFRYILKRDLSTDLGQILPLALKQLHREALPIQVNGEIIHVPLDDILYLEVRQHEITLVTRSLTAANTHKQYSFYAALSDLEARLEPLGFLRIHKSYMVNMKYLKKFQCREATLDTGIVLRVGEKSYAENKKKFLIWKGWQ